MADVQPILYETCYHATGLYSPNSTAEMSGSDGWGISSFLPSRGLKKLQEKWRGSMLPKLLKKEVALFVSPKAEFIAVAARNQITFMQKNDKYMDPCGFYMGSKRIIIFTHGAWSESSNLLALLDESDNAYVVKPNGEEILKVTKTEWKLSAPAVGLFVLDSVDIQSSYVCAFHILTSNGLVHRIEVNRDFTAILSHASLSSHQDILNKHYPSGSSCLDFHQALSFLVLSGAIGSHKGAGCSLSLWFVSGVSDLQLLSCIQYEGTLCTVGSPQECLTDSKVIISPQGTHVAALDLVGNLNIFNLDIKTYTLSIASFDNQCCREMGSNTLSGGKKCINEITDMVWRSDSALIIRKRGGIVTIVDVDHGVKLLETDLVFASPILGRVTPYEGVLILLDSNVLVQDLGQATYDGCKLEGDGKEWKLVSLRELSVLEMYQKLVNGKQYDAALNFAERHKLNKDEVFKEQWLSSGQGTDDISRFLYNVKDVSFVLSECINTFGPTEEAAKALLLCGLHLTDKYRFSETDNNEDNADWNYRMSRIQLLHNRDRLDTFLGINMGRYSMYEYAKFQGLPLSNIAVSLAESGKIGAINLLFKRHLYFISPFILEILTSIPETIPVHTYSQLLPGRSPPCNITLREKDWVEGDKTVAFIQRNRQFQNTGSYVTEHIINQLHGCAWPSDSELSQWYINRAVDIDSLSGQVENCLSLLDVGCRKNILELQQFYEDALFFYKFVFSDAHTDDENINMSLASWKQLSDYEKFKIMLERVKENTVLETLKTESIPFMQKKWKLVTSIGGVETVNQALPNTQHDSLLVRWLKDLAAENKLEVFLAVIDEGCKDFENNKFFVDEKEAIEVILDSLYLCKLIDKWNIMASILSKVPLMSLRYKATIADKDLSSTPEMQVFGSPGKDNKTLNMLPIPISLKDRAPHISIENLERRIKKAENHVESGRLLAYYQVPKPLYFFLDAQSDEKGVKQILRLILSKFGRRQPMRSDNEWANMWRDMICLQEKAFPFLESEYMLLEFCRGLLKAGKFSLARNYLKGIGTTSLASEKAEYLVVQAAREYFFSASSLDCSEIWRAKECLNIFPNSRTVRAEMDIIDALTINLPNLGVTLLPMQYRQIGSPMEIVNMIIPSQAAAYLNIDEILEVARLLGLDSPDDVAAVQETVARESAVAGDLEMAFGLCLVLVRKGHGPVWDLCATMGRGTTLENVSIDSRKELLGFALTHCDENSVLELLQAWKDLDMQSQYEKLVALTGTQPPRASTCGSLLSFPVYTVENTVNTKAFSGNSAQINSSSEKLSLEQCGDLKSLFHRISKVSPLSNGCSCRDLIEDSKFLSFATSRLPWLCDLINFMTHDTGLHDQAISARPPHTNVSFQAVKTIIAWLANNNIAPSDDIIASLAKPFTHLSGDEELLDGCLYLLNLSDAFHGVEVIEEQMRSTKSYRDISRITDLGTLYGLVHNSASQCLNPDQRRCFLLHTSHGRHTSISPGEMQRIDSAQYTFWREWKAKLQEQKSMANKARTLEKIIPGIETTRFLSGDKSYMRNAVFSFVESVRHEKKHILHDALNLADAYGITKIEVLVHFLRCSLVSQIWTEDDIESEISDFKKNLLNFPHKVAQMLSMDVYPEIDGHNKQRLSYLYGILSDCCSQFGEEEYLSLGLHVGQLFYKVLEQECRRVSIISELNFKNIAGLTGLNFGQLDNEVCNHLNESNVEALAQMVDTLGGYSGDSVLLTRKDVYKHLVRFLLEDLQNGTEIDGRVSCDDFRVFIFELEKNYERCSKYMRDILESDAVHMYLRYFSLSLPSSSSSIFLDVLAVQDCLVLLLKFWIRLADDLHGLIFERESESIHSKWKTLSRCLEVFTAMIVENNLTSNAGWKTICKFIEDRNLVSDAIDVLDFCRSMLFADCGFRAVANLFVQTKSDIPAKAYLTDKNSHGESETLCFFYRKLTESLLTELSDGCDVGESLQLLISSLRKQVDCLSDLKSVRYTVWEALNVFSENMQVPTVHRMYVLELLQSITGGKECSRSAETSFIQPWEGWAESCSLVINESVESSNADNAGMSKKFANTLVALKSNEIISAVWPGVEITPNDLSTVQSAVSCFSYLATSAVSETHIHSLQHLLGEWEELFSYKETSESKHEEVHGDNWTGDGWDASWEKFEEDNPVVHDDKISTSFRVHPLHACWRIVLQKLIGLQHFLDVVKCVDHSLIQPKTILLDEEEARELSVLLIGIDSFVALKVVLLLPYSTLWFDCLQVVDAKLKEERFGKAFGRDYEFLVLMLSSGVVSTLVTDAKYRNLATYLCYSAGFFMRIHQEYRPGSLKSSRTAKGIEDSCMFAEITFPYFIAELMKAKQYLLAGVFVTKFMHAHSSMTLINVAESSLRKFIMDVLERSQKNNTEEKPVMAIVNSITKLKEKLPSSLESGLFSLSTDVKC